MTVNGQNVTLVEIKKLPSPPEKFEQK